MWDEAAQAAYERARRELARLRVWWRWRRDGVRVSTIAHLYGVSEGYVRRMLRSGYE